jgi:VWA domain-containing protein
VRGNLNGRRGARRVRMAGPLLMACALLAPLAPGGAAAQGGEANGRDDGPEPIDFAIVVDQSASLSQDDLDREVEAAATIAQAEISERSRATVVGFGSSEREGQAAAYEACEPTVLDATGRQRLSTCVQDLARPDRTTVGPGTDFSAAINQALDGLDEDDTLPESTPQVIFLLTDGRLDVSDSSTYGPPGERQENGRRALNASLADARQQGVQVWPLGFGTDIDRAALRSMAASGYVEGCADLPDATPRMRVVDESGDLLDALQRTFAAARCAQYEPGTSGTPPARLEVTIPPIATDGSITVSKGASDVAVTYFDPDGREVPLQGEADGSAFEVSGRDRPVEALRVTNPEPGTWRVHLEPGDGSPAREATVGAIWQGRLLTSVVVNPPSPRPGEAVTVETRLQTRDGVVIDDPELLAGLSGSARLAVDGLDPVTAPLRDDGRGTDEQAGDLVFSGSIAVPGDARGDFTVTSVLAAPGVVGEDARPSHGVIAEGTPPVAAGLTILDDQVHPGGSVSGTVSVTNNDDRPHTLRLAIEDRAGAGGLLVRPPSVRAEPGGSETVPFTIEVGEDIPLGGIAGRIEVRDEDDGGRMLHQVHLDITVTAPPTWWDRHAWAVAGGAAVALLCGVVVALMLELWRRRRDPTGLEVELRHGGRKDTLKVRRTKGGVFDFVVERPPAGRPTLAVARDGAADAYKLWRDANGNVLLRPGKGQQRTLRLGEPFPLDHDAELIVRAGSSARTAAPTHPGSPGQPSDKRHF